MAAAVVLCSIHFAYAGVSCGAPNHDFGEAEDTASISCSFIVENNGAKPLRILSARPDCDCITITLKKDAVAPAGRASIGVVMDLEGFSGPVKREIELLTDDPQSQKIIFVISGIVKPAIEAEPKSVVFVFEGAGSLTTEFAECSVIIGAHADRPVSLITAESTDPRVSVSWPKDRTRFPVTLSLTAAKEAGDARPISGSLVIMTTHPRKKMFYVPFSERSGFESPANAPKTGRVVRIEFFYRQGCPSCGWVTSELIPYLQARFGDACAIDVRDPWADDWGERVSAFVKNSDEQALKGAVHVVVDGTYHMSGRRDIAQRLPALVTGLIKDKKAGGTELEPVYPKMGKGPVSFLTLTGTAVAGLIDGINPCAFSTIVFFVSVLSVLRAPRAVCVSAGLGFLAGTFTTYTVIGLGLLNMFTRLEHFSAAREIIGLLIISSLAVLSGLSLVDALRFYKNADAQNMILRTPAPMLKMGRGIMKKGMAGPLGVFAGALAVSAFVTLIESVCTGQLYLPTLAYIIRREGAGVRACALLALYNIMFVVPAALVISAFSAGFSSRFLSGISRRGVVISKLLLAAGFFVLAVLMLYIE